MLGRPLERVVEIVTGQPDLAWVHRRAAGVQPQLLEAPDGHPTVLTNGTGAHGPASGEYVAALVLAFYKNLGRFRRGEPLLNVVDREEGY